MNRSGRLRGSNNLSRRLTNRWIRTPHRQTLSFRPSTGPKGWNSTRFSFHFSTGTLKVEEKTSRLHTCSNGRPVAAISSWPHGPAA